jgi:hypothetical protein
MPAEAYASPSSVSASRLYIYIDVCVCVCVCVEYNVCKYITLTHIHTLSRNGT